MAGLSAEYAEVSVIAASTRTAHRLYLNKSILRTYWSGHLQDILLLVQLRHHEANLNVGSLSCRYRCCSMLLVLYRINLQPCGEMSYHFLRFTRDSRRAVLGRHYERLKMSQHDVISALFAVL